MTDLKLEGEIQIQPKAAWELKAEEIVFPFNYTIGQKTSPLFVHMKPYRADDLKALLTETAPAVKVEDDENSEIVKTKPERNAAFFWKHFIRLSGHGRAATDGDPSLETQKQLITNNPRLDIPQKAVLDGFGGIATKPEPPAEEGADASILDLFSPRFDIKTTVQLEQRVCLNGSGVVKLEMQHNFRRETAAEYQRYERATDKQVINRKRQSYQRVLNHTIIEQLYDAMIESVDGMTVSGAPCTASNKDAWVELVPYWHKQLAVLTFFGGVQVKNA